MSARVGAAIARANIAFTKYWGKRPYPGNYPATPSLSMTVDALSTRTRVEFDASLTRDSLILDGREQTGRPLARVIELLDSVRAGCGARDHARVVSRNDFPTASGLASSASGFAAVALAAVRALALDWDGARVSDLARQSSASAARSLFGGFVELPSGPGEVTTAPLPARPVALDVQPEWRLVFALSGAAEKAVGSTDGMRRTEATSPFYAAWLQTAPDLHAAALAALARCDLEGFGEVTERSALAMHASAMGAGVMYLDGTTVAALAAVRELRAAGVPAYATMDAGPHVKVLCDAPDLARISTAMRAVPGVTRVVEARPGDGASEIDPELVS